MNIEGTSSASSILSQPAEEFENNPDVELMWVIKATEHMEIYFNLLCSVNPQFLRLTPHDDKIYEEFRKEFPDMGVNMLDEEKLKSENAKCKWRPFCNRFEKLVEDFNFGTLVRIDSSKDYTKENTIFVPRIQFYAIEIARNREGCNDSIRKTFCNVNKETENVETKCIANQFETELQRFLFRFCQQHSLVPFNVSSLLKKENGSLRKGDYSLYFGKPEVHYLLSYLHEVGENLQNTGKDWCLPTSHYNLLPSHRMQLFLNHSLSFKNILTTTCKKKKTYGMQSQTEQKTVLINSIISITENNGLTSLRTKLCIQHISALLTRNGFNVYCIMDDDKEEIINSNKEKIFNQIKCTRQCQRIVIEETLRRKMHESEYLIKPKNNDSSIKEMHDIYLDAGKFLRTNNYPIRAKGYNENIGNIYIESDRGKEIFNKVVNIEHILIEHLEVVDILIHVTPNSKSYLQQQLGIVIDMFCCKKPKKQVFFSHESVLLVKESQNLVIGVEQYTKKIQQELEKSLVHKYGEKSVDSQWQKEYLNVLTDTVIKFEFLLSSPSVPIKLNFADTMANKVGTFVQYNNARLSMLFQQHEHHVNSGKYPALPIIEDVNFSLLTSEEEWHLLFNYVLVFPQLVSSIVDEILKDTPKLQLYTQKVCRFLMNLSQDLSTYYSRVHILVEPRSHLLQIMAARLWLLKGIQQVINNSLDLLNISPLQKM